MIEPKKKKSGRPAKFPGEGKRPTLTFRVRGGMHEQLQQAAAASGRSISEEVEYRVQRAFDFEERAGGHDTSVILELLSSAIRALEIQFGKKWFEDDEIKSACRSAIDSILNLAMPVPNLLTEPDREKAQRLQAARQQGYVAAATTMDHAINRATR